MTKKIIVIDDSRTARLQVRNALTRAGYDVVEAVDGQDGFETIVRHRNAHAIVCDMNMPRMSGLELLRALQAEGTCAAIPFFMMTTETEAECVQQARLGGARGWIVKPFKPDVLLATLGRLAG